MIQWNDLQKEMESGANKTYDWLASEYSKISSGRANINLFTAINVNVYGSFMPLNQVANVQIVEARQVIIKPYDRSQIKDIAKAIEEENLKVTLQINSDNIRAAFAPLTEETRKINVKKAKEILEQAKSRIRTVRQDVQSRYKKAADISDDQIRGFEDDLNKLTKKVNSNLEEIFIKKEKELMAL